jgi:hypothetical protein
MTAKGPRTKCAGLLLCALLQKQVHFSTMLGTASYKRTYVKSVLHSIQGS